MFYSKTLGGFLIDNDGKFSDSVEITTDDHIALLAGQSDGKRIVADENGRPMLADPPAPTTDQLAAAARAKRDALIAATDWVVLRAQETGKPVGAEWLTYRQALRDVPAQKGFPSTVTWPTAPEAT